MYRGKGGRVGLDSILLASPGKTSGEYLPCGPDDSVESTLRLVEEFVGQALSEYRLRRRGEPQQDLGSPQGQLPAARPVLARLIQRVQHRPAQVTVAWHSWADRGRVDPLFLELLHETPLSGGRLRVVTDQDSVGECDSHLSHLVASGAQVRVHNSVLPDLLVVGSEAAVLRSTTSRRGPQEHHLVTADGLVASLAKLIQATWVNSADLDVYQRLELDHDSLPRSVLTHLSAGLPDEMAARKLDISVRTYRRHVADIMQRLNAGSRFQAGFEVARLILNNYDD